jgi:hypothetical protein
MSLGTVWVSDNSIIVPPYGGIVDLGSGIARNAFPKYVAIYDCFSSSGGAIHWDINQLDAFNVVVQNDEHNIGTSCGQEWVYIHTFAPTSTHVQIAFNTSGSFADSKGRWRLFYTDDPTLVDGVPIIGGGSVFGQASFTQMAECCADIKALVSRVYQNAP